jgi:N-alpha-acetyltransferase 35, NatC auxiliary subunit
MSIVDNTLRNLFTWIDGGSLAQTLFTNLYLHQPNSIVDNYIKTFSIGILKITELIRNIILSAGTYEEEDFQPMHYNFKFAPDITDAQCNLLLKDCEDKSAKLFRHLKSELSTTQNENDFNLANGLLARIKFVRNLYQIMQHINETCSNEDVKKYIQNCRETLIKIKETHQLGIQPIYAQIGKIGKTIKNKE